MSGLRGSALVALIALPILGCGSSQTDGQSQSGVPSKTPEAPKVQVEVTSPSDGTVFRAAAAVIRGTVTSGAIVEVNGHRAKVRGRRFSRAIKLADLGTNAFDIDARKAGYSDAETVTMALTRRRSPQEIAAIRERRRQRELAAQQRRAQEIAAATKTFSGNGDKNIGTIHVDEESILEWTNVDDPEFRQMLIYDKDFGISVSSEAASGDTVVPPGTYPNVTVAGGTWTITIHPRG